jgi:hypothetical protein
MRKHLFDLLFVRLVLVAVGDKEFRAQEAGDVKDFHFLGLLKRCQVSCELWGPFHAHPTHPRLQLRQGDFDTGWLLSSLQHDQLNLFFDQLAQQESEQFSVIRRLVNVFSEALQT